MIKHTIMYNIKHQKNKKFNNPKYDGTIACRVYYEPEEENDKLNYILEDKMKKEKLCKNCKYMIINEDNPKCSSEHKYDRVVCIHSLANPEIDLVEGTYTGQSCYVMRIDDYKCGRNGDWYEEVIGE